MALVQCARRVAELTAHVQKTKRARLRRQEGTYRIEGATATEGLGSGMPSGASTVVPSGLRRVRLRRSCSRTGWGEARRSAGGRGGRQRAAAVVRGEGTVCE